MYHKRQSNALSLYYCGVKIFCQLLFTQDVNIRSGNHVREASLTFTHITDDVAGMYTCVAYGRRGLVVSRSFDIAVSEPVLVTLQIGDILDDEVGQLNYMLYYSIPINTKHLYNICTMLDQRRRRWADVVQLLCKCFVFTGMGEQVLRYSMNVYFIFADV